MEEIKIPEPCPGFGVDWSAFAKECKACNIVYKEYALKCKELFLQTSTISEDSKKEVFFKKTNRVNKHKLCKQMILDGKSREEIIDALKQDYIKSGHTENYAKSRIRSIYYNAEKDIYL